MEYPSILKELSRARDVDIADLELYEEFASGDALEAWFPVGVDAEPHFAVFGQDGSGGLFAHWLYEGVHPDEAPIVLLGSEGETELLANSVQDFLALKFAEGEGDAAPAAMR